MFHTQTAQALIDSNLINISVKYGTSILDHAHKEIEFIYCIKGNLLVKVDNNNFQLDRLDFLLINSNELHSFQSEPDTLFVVIHFNYVQLSSLIVDEKLAFACNSVKGASATDQELRVIIEQLLSIYLKQGSTSLISFFEKAFNLISFLHIHYLKYNKHLNIKKYSPEEELNKRLKEILEYIHNNFRDPLSMEEVAGVQFISIPYLSKFFKKQTSKTFYQYLSEIRLAHAVNELINSDKSITRVALDNGFPNLSAFNRVFSERYQVKPLEYKKKYLELSGRGQKFSTELAKGEKGEALQELQRYMDNHSPNLLFQQAKSQRKIISTEKVETYTPFWSKVINIGYATDLLISDMREQITVLQNEIGFMYARIWGLFSDDMNIENYTGDTFAYNFSNINKLLDFMIKNRLKPFIELGPKPKLVIRSIEQTVVFQKSSNRSLEEWKNLIRAFLSHCIDRYGVEEVETWYFELWSNAMDSLRTNGNSTSNIVSDSKLFGEYFKIFSFIKSMINEIIPGAKVGGCGLTMDLDNDTLDSFLKQWKLQSAQPDFFSINLFPIEVDNDKSRTLKKNMLSTNADYISNKLNQIKISLQKAGFDKLELNVTEWNISISNRDFLNDSCFKAVYLIKNIIDNFDQQLNMLGYWMCSDIFSDFRDSKNLLHGGAGLITKSGIKKPSYYAFLMLKQLGAFLVARGDNYIVTKKTGDRYQIICYNYKDFDYSYYLHPAGSIAISEQYNIFQNNDPLQLTFEIHAVTNGKYRIKEQRLNRDHGSVLDEWLRFGSVDDMKQDEVEYLKQKCIPYMKVDHTYAEYNTIILTSELQPHEVKLFELTLVP
jgi:xylan 1,4-beta-xylosidase